MGKALNTFIILNLFLSAGMIALGMKSFSERQLLKAEAIELEQTVAKLSTQLKWGEDVAWEKPEEKKSSAFTFSQPISAQDLNALESELDDIARFAKQRQSQLNIRSGELVTTKRSLLESKENLVARERELAAAREQKADLIVANEKVESELAQAAMKLSTLQEDNQAFESSIRTKNDDILTLNNKLASLEIDLETIIQERDLAQSEYNRCRTSVEGESAASGNVRGAKGMVLAVNNDWQYVVIDKGNLKIEPSFQAFVHRGKDYVAKLNVVRVEDNLAIAEIIPGSANGETVKPGDVLFF